MRAGDIIKKLALLGVLTAAGMQLACTKTVIVYKPSPNIDPMPKMASHIAETEKADPMFDKQWDMKKVGLDKQELDSVDFMGNYNVKVAILSTGVDYNHEDLIGQVMINKKEITRESDGDKPGVNGKDDDNNGLVDDVVGYDVIDGDGFAYDRHGAGTAVAGIIAARRGNGKGISGLVKNVSIYPIRYINDNGQGSVATLASALNLAAEVKPDVAYIQATEFKLGGDRQDPNVIKVELSLVRSGFQKLHDLGIPVIVGAGDDLGNFGSSEMGKVLSSFDNIVVVTSTDENDQIPFMANTSFQSVLTAAPGENIFTLKPHNQYGYVSGTAYAAAHVAGAYALAKAQFGNRVTYKQLNSMLVTPDGSDVVTGLTRMVHGGNRLNVEKFLSGLRNKL